MNRMPPHQRAQPVSAILPLAGPPKVENILVQKLRGKRYEVQTIPFFAYNLSFGDFVECAPGEDDIGLCIEKVVKRSGNRTIRVGFIGKGNLDHPEAKKFRAYLRECDLRSEVFKPALLAINIPRDLDCDALETRLAAISKDAGMEWEYGDPQPERKLDGTPVKQRKNRRAR